MVAGALADVVTKSWVFSVIPSSLKADEIVVIDGFFSLTRTTNSGAMWSLLQDFSAWLWIVIRGGVFVLLLMMYLHQRPVALFVRIGFGLVLAGALGNLYDNAFYEGGVVRDWLKFVFGDWVFPIFNLADSFICVGAPLLLFHFARTESARPAETEAAT